MLELEDRISEQVAEAILPELTKAEREKLERRGTNKPEANAAYMRGRFFWSRFTDEYLARAVDAFKEAISIDPEYALPHIGLADYYIWAAIFGEIPSTEGNRLAQQSARRALEIDDSIGEAYAVLAFCVLLGDWNWEEAERLSKISLELSPNYGFGHEAYSNFLCAQGRFAEALTAIRRAEELDPVSPRAILMTAWTLYQTRDFDRSAEKGAQGQSYAGELPSRLAPPRKRTPVFRPFGGSRSGSGKKFAALAYIGNAFVYPRICLCG